MQRLFGRYIGILPHEIFSEVDLPENQHRQGLLVPLHSAPVQMTDSWDTKERDNWNAGIGVET